MDGQREDDINPVKPSRRWLRWGLAGLGLVLVVGLGLHLVLRTSVTKSGFIEEWAGAYQPTATSQPSSGDFSVRLAQAARQQTLRHVTYDPAYVSIQYPGGDVPEDRGVCSDVVVRAYRALGVDLQVAVHEDMERAFAEYPRIWGLRTTDTNIDHRRVPNLMTFFRRHGVRFPIDRDPKNYPAGNLVVWDLGGGTVHIGIVSDNRPATGGPPMVIHNIGAGPKEEDVLFKWRILGNFKYAYRPGGDGANP